MSNSDRIIGDDGKGVLVEKFLIVSLLQNLV